MSQLLRLLQKSPDIVRLYGVARDAAHGDPRALDYLKREGLYDIAEIWRTGGGVAARQLVQTAREVIRPTGEDVIDAEYREVGGPPWDAFLRRVFAQPNGAHIILGPVGSGKTSLAIKLAHRFHLAHGYKVNTVSMYPEDLPDFATPISTETLVKRMNMLRAYLRAVEDEDADDELDDKVDDDKSQAPARLPPRRRVIIIDEAGMTLSSNPHDPVRQAALRALAQCRHVNWQVIYIGQLAGQFPLGLLGQSIVWVKRPDGREMDTDRISEPFVRRLWEQATEAFHNLRSYQWYGGEEAWQTPKSWAFVDAQSVNGGPGFSGLVPFTPYQSGEGDDGEDDDEDSAE